MITSMVQPSLRSTVEALDHHSSLLTQGMVSLQCQVASVYQVSLTSPPQHEGLVAQASSSPHQDTQLHLDLAVLEGPSLPHQLSEPLRLLATLHLSPQTAPFPAPFHSLQVPPSSSQPIAAVIPNHLGIHPDSSFSYFI